MCNCDTDPPNGQSVEHNSRRRRWLMAGVAGVTAIAGIVWLTNGSGLTLTDSSKPVMSGNEVDDGRGKEGGATEGKEGPKEGKEGAQPSGSPAGVAPGGKEGSAPSDQGGKEDGGKRDGGKPLPCDPDELVAAVNHANANGGGKIRLATDCNYTLTANERGDGLPKIVQPIEITGEETTIARAADADPFRIFTVGVGGELTLRHVTLKNGKADHGLRRQDAAAFPGLGSGLRSGLLRGTRGLDGTGAGDADTADADGAGTANGSDAANGPGAAATDGPNGAVDPDAVLDPDERPGYGGTEEARLYDSGSGRGGAILVKAGGTLHLEHSAIRDSTATLGGAISNAGTATISASTISDNTATHRGGGIQNEGSLFTEHSHLTYNKARYSGGALENSRGTAELKHTAIGNNAAGAGGGIRIDGYGTVTTVRDSTINDNTAGRDGGGVHNDGGPLTLSDTTVSRNTAAGDGGGILNTRVFVAEDTVINANRSTDGNGGGIASRDGDTVLRRSEVTANKASGLYSVGGGIFNEDGTLVLTDSRVIDNSSTRKPGGVFSRHGQVEVDHKSVIIKNRPTNCVGSPDEIPNCFG